jgi:hypothetical protein
VSTIQTQAPTPARLFRRCLAALHVVYLRIGLKAAKDDAEAYRQQAEHAQARKVIAEREAVRLQRRIEAVR